MFVTFSLSSTFLAGRAVAREEDKTISDLDITNAVARELIAADQVASHRIDVVTRDGVVELSGSVNNLLAKRFATREAETIKGVRAVVNRIEINATEFTDAQVQSNVLTSLGEDPATETWEVSVDVVNGIARLKGTVDSYADRELVEYVAAGSRGVRGVRNEITVDFDTSRADGEIEREIAARLAASAWIDDGLIDVQVQGGNVTLSGSVGSAWERSLAKRKAWVAGVRLVNVERLDVQWWLRNEMQRDGGYAKLDDLAIEDAIRDAYSYDPRVTPFEITVVVVHGAVTLTGVVDNLKAKHAAEQDARNTKGVWRVDNYLRVRGKTIASDRETLSGVNAALRRDTYLYQFDIEATVDNGHVYLRGIVDSQFEKERAGDVVSTVDGVVAVTNHLRVSEDYDSVSDDLNLKADIDTQFLWSPYLDLDKIDVTVTDGVATLTGTVDNWTEWGAAQDNALEAGARRVINNLQIK
jgi:osmotically-inducible protein OsmY